MIILSIKPIGIKPVVYDIETEAGTFVAGSLKHGILVKNTDSCYVKFNISRKDFKTNKEFMEKIFETAAKCAVSCTKQFKKPISLEFEKVMCPLLLDAKKRYAFKEWETPEKFSDEITYKGLQLVRRDTCPYVKEELNFVIKELIFSKNSVAEAKKESVEYIRNSVKNLLSGNIDINKLVLSKELKLSYKVKKDNETYVRHWTHEDIVQVHVKVAQIIHKENPSNCYQPPDRVPYIFIENKNKKCLQWEKVISPEKFDPKIHKIDTLHYFQKQFQKPIDTIFQYIVIEKGKSVPEKIYNDLVTEKINTISGQPGVNSFLKKNKIQTLSFDIKKIKMLNDDDNPFFNGLKNSESDPENSDSDVE